MRSILYFLGCLVGLCSLICASEAQVGLSMAQLSFVAQGIRQLTTQWKALQLEMGCSDLPVCSVDGYNQRLEMSVYEAVDAIRRKSIVIIGADDSLASDVRTEMLNVLSKGEFYPEKPGKPQRVGSSKITYFQAPQNVPFGSFLNSTISELSVDNDLTVIFLPVENSYSHKMGEEISRTLALSFSATTPTLLISYRPPVLPEGHNCFEKTSEQIENSRLFLADMVEYQPNSVNKIWLISLGDNSLYYDEFSCSPKSNILSHQIAVSLFHSVDLLWPKEHASAGEIALLFVFVPIIIGTFFLEIATFQRERKMKYLDDVVEIDSVTKDAHFDIELSSTRTSVTDAPSSDLNLLLPQNEGHCTRMTTSASKLVSWYQREGRVVARSALAIFAVLLLCYLQDFWGDHLHLRFSLRQHNLDAFISTMVIVLLVSLLTVRSHPEDISRGLEILHRDQTEEWKGIMQLGFILYHYFHAEETYNLIRIFIACYVWMTGFGNFSYFFRKEDWSFSRLLKMVYRMNLFVLFLMWTMKTEYMLYYICPLHTFFFMVTYFATLPIKWASPQDKIRRSVISLAMLFILLTAVFESERLFKIVFSIFPFLKLNGSLHEWWFRAKLDHYSTWFGMVCALAFPAYCFLQKKLDSIESRQRQFFFRSLFIGISCLSLVLYSKHVLFAMDKFSYNAIHPYTFWIPVSLYIFLRNSLPILRTRYLSLLSWMGKITLETYLLQFHIWLADDAKTVLVYFPGFPTLNFLFVSAVYILCAYAVFHATNHLTSFLVPQKASLNQLLLRNISFIAILTISYGFGYAISPLK